MKRLLLLAVLSLCYLPSQADIIETAITLPNELGTGVMYLNDKQKHPKAGVIVVHEWWGLNDYARNRARMLAEQGYAALAIDMYGTGEIASHPKDAMTFMQAALAEPDTMNARFDAAMALMRQQQQVIPSKLFAIGYCFGGAVVLEQARRGLDLAGVASFHGSLSTENPAQTDKVKARVLVATGQADPMVPAEQVAGLVNEMTQAGVDFQLMSFPGVKHSFTNPQADTVGERFQLPLAYDAHADQSSWNALLNMLEAQ